MAGGGLWPALLPSAPPSKEKLGVRAADLLDRYVNSEVDCFSLIQEEEGINGAGQVSQAKLMGLGKGS